MNSNTRYQVVLITLLSINFGIVFFDRNAYSFLVPFIQPDLKLTNVQIGMIASALSFSWAIAGLFVGWLSDRIGRRKIILVIATLIFSGASVLSGLAGSFLALMGARLLMGIAEGGVMPISQTLIAAEVAPERRGLAQGVTQNFGANLIANFLGPIIIVAMAVALGWRNAFLLAAIPGFVMTVLIAWFVRDPEETQPRERVARSEVWPLLADRNIVLCVLLSILLVAFLVIFSTFMPLYLVQVRGIDQSRIGVIMAIFGLASMAVAFLVPGASDRFGRRPVAVGAALLGLALPLGVLWSTGTESWPIMASLAIGSAISGVFPLVMATIPSEVAKPSQTATALSLTMGTSEIIGGVLAPSLAGWAADRVGLAAPLWIVAALCLAICVGALALRETAPVVLARRAAATSASGSMASVGAARQVKT